MKFCRISLLIMIILLSICAISTSKVTVTPLKCEPITGLTALHCLLTIAGHPNIQPFEAKYIPETSIDPETKKRIFSKYIFLLKADDFSKSTEGREVKIRLEVTRDGKTNVSYIN